MELKHYFETIRKRLWLIVAIVIVITGVTGIVSVQKQPLYQANATLIVNQASLVEGASIVNLNSIQTNIMLINSYKEIIRSGAIMNQVVKEYPELNLSTSELIRNIEVSAASDSQVMNLAFTDSSYNQAAKKVNAIAEVFRKQIPQIMKVDNVTILNSADEGLTGSPINVNVTSSILAAVIVSIAIGLGLVFLLDYLDGSYKSEKELENDLEVPVLATIAKIGHKERQRVSDKKREVGEGKYVTLN